MLKRADTTTDPSDEPLLRKDREVAPNGDLRYRKDFRKFRNVNGIAGFEHLQNVVHPLLLRQNTRVLVATDGADPTPRPGGKSRHFCSLPFEMIQIESDS